MRQRIGLDLEEDVLDKLDQLAYEKSMSRTAYIEMMIDKAKLRHPQPKGQMKLRFEESMIVKTDEESETEDQIDGQVSFGNPQEFEQYLNNL